MNESETNRRTDPALIGILDETTSWAVRDTSGTVTVWAASLADGPGDGISARTGRSEGRRSEPGAR
jgi:hypothetical protein